ncbi:MAG TPA: type 2 isopentenyl-diphosphate Delta-isomerase [Bacillota bacterium]|nr:type 2 isopentenyl-diphosphate Delta-isomerase [Bacillota bacterium]
MQTRTTRKTDHIQFALETGQSGHNGFADVLFVPNCIPQTKFDQISLMTTFGGLKLSSPIVINAMTGGAVDTLEINRRLASLAREAKLTMAVGSQMAAIKDPSVSDFYTIVRKVNPEGIIFANLGSEATVDQAKQAVEMIEADGLQIHLNVMQELIMPEGDRDFRGSLERIFEIAQALTCPVIVKEVGFGMSWECAKELTTTGIRGLDLGGSGGTNFALIENKRRDIPLAMLNDWGMTTVQSLLEMSLLEAPFDCMATGGISDGGQIAKALALGARAVGMAGFFLRLVSQHTEEKAYPIVVDLENQLRLIMTSLGARNIHELQETPLVIEGKTYHWATQRGIDCRKWSQR